MSKKWIGIAMTGSLILGACGMGTQTPTKPVDNIKPTVALSIAAGKTVAGSQLVIVDAADAGGIAEVQLQKNGVTVQTLKNAPYAFMVDTTTSVGTQLTLTAVAKDKAGNVNTDSTVVSVVDANITDPGSNNTANTAAVLGAGQKVAGATISKTDEAWYKFEVDGSKGDTRFVVTPQSIKDSTLDLVLTVYQEVTEDGKTTLKPIGQSDQGGPGGFDPPLAFTAKAKTTYYAQISSYEQGDFGNYTLKLDVFGQVGDVSATVNVPLQNTNNASVSASASKEPVVVNDTEDKFVPGQLLVLLNTVPTKVNEKLSTVQRQKVTNLADRIVADYGLAGADFISPEVGLVVLKGKEADLSSTMSKLAQDTRVKSVSRDYIAHTDVAAKEEVNPTVDLLNNLGARLPNDEYYHNLWGMQLINAPQAWTATTGNQSVVVAVVDTGVPAYIGATSLEDVPIPDLVDQLIPGYDFLPANSSDLTTLSPEPLTKSLVNPELIARFPNFQYWDRDSHPGPDPYPFQEIDSEGEPVTSYNRDLVTSAGHGAHVAGTIGAAGDNKTGVVGVNWSVKIQPIRALTDGFGGPNSTILQSVLYAAGYPVEVTEFDAEGKPTKKVVQNPTPARVINLSLGGGGYSAVAEQIYDKVVNEAKVVVVASAGNSAKITPNYPASYPAVISVSSVDYILDSDGNPDNGYQSRPAFTANFSNFGPNVDISAPGGICWYTDAAYIAQVRAGRCSGKSADGKYNNSSNFILSTTARYNYPSTGLLTPETPYFMTPAYEYYAGTSMAAPHVSGVAALMLSVNPNLTPTQVREILRSTAQRVDDSNLKSTNPALAARTAVGRPNERWDAYYGFGVVDALKAIETVINKQLPGVVPANAKAYAVLLAGNEIRDYKEVSRQALRGLFENKPRGDYKLVIAVDTNNNRIVGEKDEWVFIGDAVVKSGEYNSTSGTFGQADGKTPIALPAEQPK